MSTAVYPSLAGETWPWKKTPQFSTIITKSQSGLEVRVANWAYQHYEIEISYSLAQWSDSTFQTLMGFILQRHGSWDTFRLLDPDDNSTTASEIGIGTGSQTQYQIGRVLGGGFDPIYEVNAITGIYLNGTATSAYTINSNGLITFTTAPGNGVVITATFTYWWRCRFDDDTKMDFARFGVVQGSTPGGMWEVPSIKMYTVTS